MNAHSGTSQLIAVPMMDCSAEIVREPVSLILLRKLALRRSRSDSTPVTRAPSTDMIFEPHLPRCHRDV
jgi:hypothetical protein